MRQGTDELTGSELAQAAECLRVLAHPKRLQLVQVLLRGRYTVGELAETCGLRSHVASEHLRLMQRCALLESARNGRRTYYRVSEPHVEALMGCIEARYRGRSAGKTG